MDFRRCGHELLQRDQRLAGTAFRDHHAGPGLSPAFGDSHNGDGLRWKRLPQQTPDAR